MSKIGYNGYKKLEIPGSFFNDNFSIYLMEINDQNPKSNKETYYYVGMTGDAHYRSARAAFYRLAGHMEYQNKRSTQNQLLKGIAKTIFKVNINDRKEISKRMQDLEITMHHFPIEGFISDPKKRLASSDYKYRTIRSKVANLEKNLIIVLSKKLPDRQLLNKTHKSVLKKPFDIIEQPYKTIFEDILALFKET